MKSTRVILAGALIATVALCGADARKDVEGLYGKYKKAIYAKDIKAMMAMTTADFSWTNPKGVKMERPAIESQLKTQFTMLKKITGFTVKIDKFSTKGDTAVARTTTVMSAEINMGNNKTSKLVSTSVSDDTWKKTPKGWMMHSVKSIKDVNTLDGKVLPSG